MLRNDIDLLIARHEKLFNSQKGALVYIRKVLENEVSEEPHVGDYNLPEGWKKFIEDSFKWYVDNFKARGILDDDLIPSVRPRLGIQEHSSFISGNNECNVDFVGETSFHHQMVFEKEDLYSLHLSNENKYFKLFKDCYEYMTLLCKDVCPLSLRGVNLSLDIANSIRGNDLLYDFYDDPEWLERLLEFSNNAALWYSDFQHKVVPKVGNGYITGFGVWVQGYASGHMAEDGTVLIGPDLYEEFCLKYTDKYLENYESALMHVHSIAHSSLPLMIRNPKIKVVEISSDPNSYRAIEVFKMYENELKDKIVNLYLTKEELIENISFLKNKRLILDFNCNTELEAREIIDFVRKELPIE